MKEQDGCSEHTINQPKAQKAASQRTSPSEFITVITAAFCQSLLFPKLQRGMRENHALRGFPLRFMVHSELLPVTTRRKIKKATPKSSTVTPGLCPAPAAPPPPICCL